VEGVCPGMVDYHAWRYTFGGNQRMSVKVFLKICREVGINPKPISNKDVDIFLASLMGLAIGASGKLPKGF